MSAAKERWAVLDCGKYPSENNCRMKMMCPADHTNEVVELAANHAVKSHGHEDSKELRDIIRDLVVFEEV